MRHSIAVAIVLAVLGACRAASSAKTMQERSYSVEGQVKHAGVQPFADDLTLFEAVAAAEPLEATSDLQRVRLTRTAVNPPLELVIDLAAMQRTGDSTNNVLIRPGDVIVVPARAGT